MRSIARQRREGRPKRHRRIRKKLSGTSERPRLAVYRSHAHIYTQLVDDVNGQCLAGAATTSPELKDVLEGKSKTEASMEVGKLIAKRAADKGIKQVSFDRGGYLYHGRIKALAESARKAGLEF